MRVALVQASWTPHSVARLRAAREHLADRGAHLEVITMAAAQEDYAWPVPTSENTALFDDKDYWRIGYRELKQRLTPALTASDPDVVVVPGWAFKESFASLGWAVEHSRSRVVVSDSQEIDSERRFAREAAKGHLVRNFDAALVGGTPHAAYLTKLGLEGSACFPGCDVVDNDFFAGAPRSHTAETPVLLSCIRLLDRKNVPMVLEVLARAAAWRWKIAGDGPERQKLLHRISELDLTDRVELLGHVPYEDLPELYRSADVYLQPSLSEPWGLAVNEAMAAGLPLLVSDRCGCAPDLVRADNGLTFDPTRPESLAKAFSVLKAERPRWSAMGMASKKRIASWGLDLYASNLLKASEYALANPQARGAFGWVLGRIL